MMFTYPKYRYTLFNTSPYRVVTLRPRLLDGESPDAAIERATRIATVLLAPVGYWVDMKVAPFRRWERIASDLD